MQIGGPRLQALRAASEGDAKGDELTMLTDAGAMLRELNTDGGSPGYASLATDGTMLYIHTLAVQPDLMLVQLVRRKISCSAHNLPSGKTTVVCFNCF